MFKPDPPFRLTPQELESTLWGRLTEYLAARLALLRVQNDHIMTDEKTNFIRGEIAAVRKMLALNEPMKITDNE